MKDSCEKAQQYAEQRQNGNSQGNSGGIFNGPGSDWWRQAMFRLVEVMVGVAMIVAGVKAFTGSSPTIKVISQGVKKVAKS